MLSSPLSSVKRHSCMASKLFFLLCSRHKTILAQSGYRNSLYSRKLIFFNLLLHVLTKNYSHGKKVWNILKQVPIQIYTGYFGCVKLCLVSKCSVNCVFGHMLCRRVQCLNRTRCTANHEHLYFE